MSWLGKVVGGAFGFIMGGPLGAALGAAFGHQFDQNGPEIHFEGLGANPSETEVLRRAFFVGVFQVMGYLAKVDGRVSESEIGVARDIMTRMLLTEDLKILAMRLFNEGKADRFAMSIAVEQFRSACQSYPHLLRAFIALQLELALADGTVNAKEEAALLRICDQLEFSRYEFFGIKTRLETERRFGGVRGHGSRPGAFWEETRHRQRSQTESLGLNTEIHEAYAVLQLKSSASETEIKTAYRRLVSRHHPDKLVGKGHDEGAVQRATEITQRIQKAYDLICKTRGF